MGARSRFETKPHFHDVGRLDDVSQELMRTGHANLNNEGALQGGNSLASILPMRDSVRGFLSCKLDGLFNNML